MAIKKGNAPKTISAKLDITGGGESNTISLVFHNRKPSEIREKAKDLETSKDPFLPSLLLYLVKEWDTGYSLSIEGVLDMEDERPGLSDALIQGFHRVRRLELEGN
ncbi:hypothetical protein [Alcaligenes endophyticus]|uniref:Tail assembly chaperone n=1 Tax=Alcaligenes endophyticus TaxID=1929088 RepID=A0ABT8EK87_9BURK|nr:hypothetical protein [Alcaligenes endophyticus]MCX5592024.1 hypothetical protein [Alcaligenes endophyticus]MDN4121714.1 hypothetical protein [Alcaligenes endophyticus]